MAEPNRLQYELSENDGATDKAPALMFLHGFTGSGRDWTETVEALPDCRCILVDLPGHGRSAGCPPDLYPMPRAALALLAVLDDLGVGQCIPVGYSMGGRLALYLALTHPDRCLALVVESGSPGLASKQERESRRQWDESKASELERQGLYAFLQTGTGSRCSTPSPGTKPASRRWWSAGDTTPSRASPDPSVSWVPAPNPPYGRSSPGYGSRGLPWPASSTPATEKPCRIW